MTLLKIAEVGHPILRERAAEVSAEELSSDVIQRFIDDLIDTMRDANGAGLAAPQVYLPRRICVIEVKDNPRYPYKPNIPLKVLINPEITPLSEETFDNYEGCLSVPNLRAEVRRYTEIELSALDRHGARVKERISGLSAGTFQHEIDHLDGKLFLDRVRDPASYCTWQQFQRYRQDAFAERVRALVARYGS